MAANLITPLVPRDPSTGEKGNFNAWAVSACALAATLDLENGGLEPYLRTKTQKLVINAIALLAEQPEVYETLESGELADVRVWTTKKYPADPDVDSDEEEEPAVFDRKLKMHAIRVASVKRHNTCVTSHNAAVTICRQALIASLVACGAEKLSILFNESNPLNSCQLLHIMTTIEEEYGQTNAEKLAFIRTELTIKPASLQKVEDWDKKQSALALEQMQCLPAEEAVAEPRAVKFERYCALMDHVSGADEALTLYKAKYDTDESRTAKSLVSFIKKYVIDNRKKLMSDVIAMKAAASTTEDTKAMAAGTPRERTYTEKEMNALCKEAARQAIAEMKKEGDGGGKEKKAGGGKETTLTDKKLDSPCYFHTAKWDKQAGHSNKDCKRNNKGKGVTSLALASIEMTNDRKKSMLTTNEQKTSLAPHHHILIAADSACVPYTLVREEETMEVRVLAPEHKHVAIKVASGSFISPKGETTIYANGLPVPALVFDKTVLDENLLSISQLCEEHKATVTFTEHDVTVAASGHEPHTTTREAKAAYNIICTYVNPWTVGRRTHIVEHIGKQQTRANMAIKFDTIDEHVKWYYAAFGYPTWQRFIDATTKGFFKVPGLTLEQVKAHPQRQSIEHDAGFMQQTPPIPEPKPRTTDSRDHREKRADAAAYKAPVYVKRYLITKEGNCYADLTGAYPVEGVDGSRYLLVFYNQDENFVKLELMVDKSAESYVEAYQRASDFFVSNHCKPFQFVLDNEKSDALVAWFVEKKYGYTFVAPNQHRANQAERIIEQVKPIIIAMLAGADEDFPAKLWSKVVPQAELVLNVLRESARSPHLSAWHSVTGKAFDFVRHPLAPFGTLVMAHVKPAQRASWAAHAERAWYIGPAMSHYRCHRVWVERTGRPRITDTVHFHSKKFKAPMVTMTEHLAASIAELTHTLERAARQRNLPDDAKVAVGSATEALVANLKTLQEVYAPPARPGQRVDEQDAAAAQRVQEEAQAKTQAPAPALAPVTDSAPAQRVIEQVAAAEGAVDADEEEEKEAAPRQRVQVATPPAQSPTPPRVRPRRATLQTKRAQEAAQERAMALAQREALTKAIKEEKAARQAKSKAKNEASAAEDAKAFQPVRPSRRSAAKATAAMAATYANPWLAGRRSHIEAFITHGAIDEQLDNATWAAMAASMTQKTAMQGDDAAEWVRANEEEYERLVEGTKTMHAIKDDGRKASYYNPQYKKNKNGYRVRGTFGGDRMPKSTPEARTAHTAPMEAIKLLIASVVSDQAHYGDGVGAMIVDVKDAYLNSTLDEPCYMRIRLDQLAPNTIAKYGLAALAKNGSVLHKITKGIYGHPEAGRLWQQTLVRDCLTPAGFKALPSSPCLFANEDKTVVFSLVVDDFFIKYRTREAAEPLLVALKKLYTITTDEEAEKYLGLTIDWDKGRSVSLSLPGYISQLIASIGWSSPLRAHAPACVAELSKQTYSRGPQQAEVDSSAKLDAKDTHFVQTVLGALLYYARAVDSTMLTAINHVATTGFTQKALAATNHLLVYAQTYSTAHVRFLACDMIARAQCDASFNGRSKGRSTQGALVYLGDKNRPDEINGAVDYFSSIIAVVCASAAEAEYAALFMAARMLIPIRQLLTDLGYKQPATLIMCDNAVAVKLANATLVEKRSKTFDNRFHWVRDRVQQGQFEVIWRKGTQNLADIFTKLLPVSAHQRLAPHLVWYSTKPTAAITPKTQASRHMQSNNYFSELYLETLDEKNTDIDFTDE